MIKRYESSLQTFFATVRVQKIFGRGLADQSVITLSKRCVRRVTHLSGKKIVAIAIFVFADIHADTLDGPVGECPFQRSADIIGRGKSVRRVHQGLVHELGVLIIGVGIFVDVISGIDDASG